MFLFLIQGASALPEVYRWKASVTEEQKRYAQTLEKPWGTEGKTAWEAFRPILKLIHEDPESLEIFEQVKLKLRQGKGTTLQEFIQYCGENGEAGGGFSQSSDTIAVTFKYQDLASEPDAEEKQKIKDAHVYGSFDVPYMRFHLGTGKPSVCVDREESVRSA